MTEFQSLVCAGCSCLCDDLVVETSDNGTRSLTTTCQLGGRFLERVESGLRFQPTINAEATTQDVAIETASKWLQESQSPLVCGLDGISTQSQKTAVSIAKQVKATIDVAFSNANHASLTAMQTVGKVTATIGEISRRTKVFLFIFCDFTMMPTCLFRHLDIPLEHAIFIGCKGVPSEIEDSISLPLSHDELGEFLTLLDGHLFGSNVRASTSSELQELVSKVAPLLKQSTHSSFFHGTLDHSTSCENTIALYRLVRELNSISKCYVTSMRNDGNALSGENVLAWSTGYAYAVDFAGEHPLHNGTEFSAFHRIHRNECDVVLACSPRSLDVVSWENVNQKTKWIVITEEPFDQDLENLIVIPVTFDFGDWVRFDNTLLPVRPLKEQLGSSPRSILESLLDDLKKI